MVEISPPDRAWQTSYEKAAAWLRSVLGPQSQVEHVGSTAVPGLGAKAIIDILVGLGQEARLTEAGIALAKRGFEVGLAAPRSEGGVFLHRPQRASLPAMNVHVTIAGNEQWNSLIAFRDRLRADQELARRYERLKRRLAEKYGGDIDAYTFGKTAFVDAVLRGDA